jgi:hypothetical protein
MSYCITDDTLAVSIWVLDQVLWLDLNESMSVEGVSRAHIESAFDELMSIAGNVKDE